jgi:rhodanese-related sulfurtransferase
MLARSSMTLVEVIPRLSTAEMRVLMRRSASLDASSLLPTSEETVATRPVILDVRNRDDFARAHVPSSIFLGSGPAMVPFARTALGGVRTQPYLVVGLDTAHGSAAATALCGAGFDSCVGILGDGFASWQRDSLPHATFHQVSAAELVRRETRGTENAESSEDAAWRQRRVLVDCRALEEFTRRHVVNAVHVPLDSRSKQTAGPSVEAHLLSRLGPMDDTANGGEGRPATVIVYCGAGYRSLIWLCHARNHLSSANTTCNVKLVNVRDGFDKLEEVAPSKLLQPVQAIERTA